MLVLRWSIQGLNRKFTVATIAGFLASSALFLALFLVFYQGELKREKAQAAVEVNRLLESALENTMLKRDLDGLLFIVERLGRQPNIRSVMIVNPQGVVRFSSVPELLGKKPFPDVIGGGEVESGFTVDSRGQEVLRSINPVENKPPCQVCHGPMEKQPINGFLVVDYDAASLRQQARNTTLMLMGAGALIVVINLLGGWWFIRRFILGPVEKLGHAADTIAAGDLDVRVDLAGKDELANLGHSFNVMAENLQANMRSLEESRQFLQGMIDAIPDGVRIIDEEYNTLLVNEAYRKQTGCPEKSRIGEKCYRDAHGLDEPCPAPLITCPLESLRKDPRPIKVVHHHRTCKDERLDVEIYAASMQITIDGRPRTLLVEAIRDLTSEVRFTHEQRLAELGRLAAGVAHEIYNPLSSMKLALGSLHSTLESSCRTTEVSELLCVVEEEMDQCIDITNRLLRLSTPPSQQEELVDLVQAVNEVISLLKWEAEKDGIELDLRFPDAPMRILSRESDMRMLVLNLVQNAFHAMPEGGRLMIEGRLVKEWAVVDFCDTGVGIRADDLPYIFMPFFSRRADGVQGTGLGLAICKAIVEEAGGTLAVDSEPGEGSCFHVRLPQAHLE